MRHGRWIASVFGVCALASCTSMKFIGGSPPSSWATYWCPGAGSTCDIEVTVDVTGATCKLRFVRPGQYELTMPSGVRGVPIRWALDDASARAYEFRRDAFRLKSGSSDQFGSFTPIMNGRQFQLANSNSNRERYEYDLVVHARSGGVPTPCSVDPFINNVN